MLVCVGWIIPSFYITMELVAMCGNKKVFAKNIQKWKDTNSYPIHMAFSWMLFRNCFLFFRIAINFWQCKNGGRTSHRKQRHTQRPTI
jgi:hypothetical protein